MKHFYPPSLADGAWYSIDVPSAVFNASIVVSPHSSSAKLKLSFFRKSTCFMFEPKSDRVFVTGGLIMSHSCSYTFDCFALKSPHSSSSEVLGFGYSILALDSNGCFGCLSGDAAHSSSNSSKSIN